MEQSSEKSSLLRVAERPHRSASVPLVTVFCLTFNHKRFIGRAIEGFLAQRTSFPVGVIVHDDASTDGTSDIVRDFARRFPGIVTPVIRTENLFRKRERIEIPSFPLGKYVAFCEGDDYWIDEEKLERQVAVLEAEPACALVGARSYLWRDGDYSPYAIEPAIVPDAVAGLAPASFFVGGPWMHTATRVWRTTFLRETYAAIPGFIGGFDLPQALYVAAAAAQGRCTIRLLDRVTSVYLKHPAGIYSGASTSEVNRQEWHMREFMLPFFGKGHHARTIRKSIGASMAAVARSDPELSLLGRLAILASASRYARASPARALAAIVADRLGRRGHE